MKIGHLKLFVPMIALTALAGCQQDDTVETVDASAESAAQPAADTPAAMKTSHVVEVIGRDGQEVETDEDGLGHVDAAEELRDPGPVSYTHLRAHETAMNIAYAVFCLK